MAGIHQDSLIEKFVAYLGRIRQMGLRVTSWPDKQNLGRPEIDAIAEGDGLRIAIEHTSIDTVPEQRQDSARFYRAVGQLAYELRGKFSGRVRVSVPFYAIPRGVDWSQIKGRLAEWLVENVPRLPYQTDPRLTDADLYSIDGVPFPVLVTKSKSDSPALILGRFCPQDNTLSSRIAELIDRKMRKLAPYKPRGYRTILLIESDDIALMNPDKMRDAVESALRAGPQPALDEVWYADTSIPQDPEYSRVHPTGRACETEPS